MKTAILTDSGCGLTHTEAEKCGLFYTPLQITINDKSYQDSYEISRQQFYEKLKENVMPKTSSPIVSDIIKTIDSIISNEYDEIICVPISSGLSGTFQTIKIICEERNIPLTLIETYSTCNIQAYVALSALKLVEKGYSSQQVKHRLDKIIEKQYSLIVPSDLNHLKRGGRLTPLAASLANLLKIKPILKLGPDTLGKIDLYGKVRTERRAIKNCMEFFDNRIDEKKYKIFVIHSDNKTVASQIAEQFINNYNHIDVQIDWFSSVIASHVGLRCIAIQIIEDIDSL